MLRAFIAVVILTWAGAATAASLPRGFDFNPYNGAKPAIADDGTIAFKISEGECSDRDYGDGRGESDCNNGNVRSAIWTEPTTKVGRAVEYSFDIRIDPGFAYAGFKTAYANGFLPDGWDSSVWPAWWKGNGLHNFLYLLKADTTKGLAFLGETCQAPEKFGQWVHFSMRVRWSDDDKGWMQVRCDDRLIYADEGRSTVQAPHCYAINQCEPGVEKHPSQVLFHLGAYVAGYGHTWKERDLPSPFTDIQDGGITFEVRNLEQRADPVAYSDEQKAQVKALQARLIELGCDPGPADGAAGKRTRDAALSCRAFGEGALPVAFNVATLDRFVELYAAPNAASLPPGSLPGQITTIAATYDVRAAETFEDTNDPGRVYAEFRAEFKRPGKKAVVMEFAIEALGMIRPDKLDGFQIMFLGGGLDGNEPLAACGAEAMTWPGSPLRLAFNAQTQEGGHRIVNTQCIADAVPAGLREKFELLVGHFSDIAVGMAKNGELEKVRNAAVKTFLTALATGETVMTMQLGSEPPAVPAPIAATYAVSATETFEDTEETGRIYAEFRAEFQRPDKKPVQMEFAIEAMNAYKPDTLDAFTVMFMGGGLKGGEKLADCDAEALDWPGSPPRLAFKLSRLPKGHRINNATCIADALPSGLREKFELLAYNFGDIAVGMAKSGELEKIRHPAVRGFFIALAKGELKVAVRK